MEVKRCDSWGWWDSSIRLRLLKQGANRYTRNRKWSLTFTETCSITLNLNSYFPLTPDWDRPQESGSYVDRDATRPKLLLFSHQENTCWEQRLIQHGPRPSSRHKCLQSSGHQSIFTQMVVKGVPKGCLFDCPEYSSKLSVSVYVACSMATLMKRPRLIQSEVCLGLTLCSTLCRVV